MSRRVVVLVASYCFYGFAGPRHLGILIAVTVLSFLVARGVPRTNSRWLLLSGLAGTFAFLFIFKYLAFTLSLATDIGWIGSPGRQIVSLALPVGISFYTFQAASYLLDVNSGRIEPSTDLLGYATYLAFFPQILAGPIERAKSLLPQLAVFRPTVGHTFLGAKLALWGYFGKLMIADRLAEVIDAVWTDLTRASALTLGATLLLFSFRIYFDFMGYTSIARGLGLMFGVRLHRNFERPYLARSIREFWRRWHVTLTSWFRDYLYIPLGGRRSGAVRFAGAAGLVFLLSGLWHGAALGFVFWGILHAALYLIGVATKPVRSRLYSLAGVNPIGRVRTAVQVIFTFGLVSIAWLPFMAEDPRTFRLVTERLLSVLESPSEWTLDRILVQPTTLFTYSILMVYFGLDCLGWINRVVSRIPRGPWEVAGELALVNTMSVLILIFGDLGQRDFIYFRF